MAEFVRWMAILGLAILGLGLMGLGGPGVAQEKAAEAEAGAEAAPEVAAGEAKAAAAKTKECKPGFGCVTDLPLPRYVSLKGNEGNARRGPGLTHRIDWVFTRSGMPLRITAEFEHWRRVEDAEGAGGWVHYSLLSGSRAVLVTTDMAEFRSKPELSAEVVVQAELGVIGKVISCAGEWCRVALDGEKGWVQTSALWGVDPGEVIE